LPDYFFKQAAIYLPPLQERLRWFSKETFQFQIKEGKHLQAELKLV